MALVTLQRSPSVASPQCSSNSDGEAEDDDGRKTEKSECFFAGKGTALVLALKDTPQHTERRLSTDSTRSTNSTQSNNSDIQQHLQSMFYLLKPQETLKMAVKVESQRHNRTRYLVIASRCCYDSSGTTTERKSKITRNNSARMSTSSTKLQHQHQPIQITSSTIVIDSNCNRSQQQLQPPLQQQQSQSQLETDISETNVEIHEKRLSSTLSTCSNRQSVKCDADKNTASGDGKCVEGIEESCLLGIDCNERTTIGLVVPILADTTIHLDGDGGFSVSVYGKTHIFKPVSVQAMWSALQTLHKVSQKARENNFYPNGPSHDWVSYYESRIESEQSCLNEWNAMDSLESRRPPSPDAIRNKPTAKEETESVIKMKLKETMMSVDLDEVTSKYIRTRLEEQLDMDLGEYKSFIDEEMLMILGQMDAPTEIFEHVYLGSEWNASNLEELQKNGVHHILNVTREIDNFFPGMFDYFNVRVYDDEKTNLLKHWDNTYRYITRAKAEGSKVLVHCKMGVSRSASVVIAYAMKAYNWEFEQALQHVKERRNCIKPNKNFLNQLETYRGMLDAMKNKDKLQRSKSETNLKSTKDARLLPGSEPTPLIQALNQSKSKSAGHGVSGDGVDDSSVEVRGVMESASSISSSSGSDQKQRRVMRRSSSTSPKSIQGHPAIVIKQQSQSLENLTPERSVADEPKNMRFPGSNGENYSVTQNQVLHIQKNTPPPPPPPMPPTSVRTIVHDLEAHKKDSRKTVDDRKSLNLQFGRSVSHDTCARADALVSEEDTANAVSNAKTLGSPVWTSSAKLITQTSNLDAVTATSLRSTLRPRRDTTGSSSDTGDMFSSQVDSVFAKEEEEKRHSRKTQSWAATTSGAGNIIVMDGLFKLGSNSSIDSVASNATSTTSTSAVYDGVVRTRPRQREMPSRHASWGSGDNRCGVPMRNSSWGSYDTNRNNFQYGNNATPSAIFEGQIHELNMSNKTATHHQESQLPMHYKAPHMGTVKRTKQKLEECTALKKLCQENGGEIPEATNTSAAMVAAISLTTLSPQKRSSNLHRSASAAGSMRSRYPHRCNSEEIVPTASNAALLQRSTVRRSDGSRPLHSDLFSASAPESYTMSDIENKNTLPQTSEVVDETTAVVLRTTPSATAAGTGISEDQRVSGNVQILKKNFEAKAGGTTISGVSAGTSSGIPSLLQASNTKKGHQSLPSSPVAQHIDHSGSADVPEADVPNNTTRTTEVTSTITSTAAFSKCDQFPTTATTATATISSSSSPSSVANLCEPCDRNVKGLVHKYQATTTPSSSAASSTTTIVTTSASNCLKPRPRSYYENHPHNIQQKSLSGRPHDYSDSRPPPAPAKTTSSTATTTHSPFSSSATESLILQQQQHQQHRRLQHGKTHPLTRLPKQSFNAAAYNTILFHMFRSVTCSFDNNNNKNNNYNNNNN